MLSARLGNNTVEFIEVGVKVKNVNGNPFHDVCIFWQHDDSLEITLDESSVGEGGA